MKRHWQGDLIQVEQASVSSHARFVRGENVIRVQTHRHDVRRAWETSRSMPTESAVRDKRHAKRDEHLTWRNLIKMSSRLDYEHHADAKEERLHRRTFAHSFESTKAKRGEQTSAFHACSVNKLMLILIEKTTQTGDCSSETSMGRNGSSRRANDRWIFPGTDEERTFM